MLPRKFHRAAQNLYQDAMLISRYFFGKINICSSPFTANSPRWKEITDALGKNLRRSYVFNLQRISIWLKKNIFGTYTRLLLEQLNIRNEDYHMSTFFCVLIDSILQQKCLTSVTIRNCMTLLPKV